jgi:hypothetical protein
MKLMVKLFAFINLNDEYKKITVLEFMNKYLYIRDDIWPVFCNKFKYYICKNVIDDLILNYDNLVNLLIMVKNAGAQFEQMLLDNLHIIDKFRCQAILPLRRTKVEELID